MTQDSLPDSSVLIDMFGVAQQWHDWSLARIEEARLLGRIIVSPTVYAELASKYSTHTHLDDDLPESLFAREQLPWEAAFLAGKAFGEYRRRGGPRDSLLPDFFIGAHASVMGYRVITRDPRRLRRYFPNLEIVAPDVG